MSDTQKKGHVFISHSSEDKEFVRSLAAQLKNRDIPVWVDEEELLPGANWQSAIERAIRDASVILVVVSENSAHSSWQNLEIGMALSLTQQMPPDAQLVIPIRLRRDDQVPELPYFLKMRQSLESNASDVADVAESVANAIERSIR